jgi:phospholipid/cholesterol/gamma-HCH transport system substrate-binding protein
MRRIYVNLVAFALLTTAAIAWSAVNFLHLDAIERPILVTAEFEASPGLRAGYEVTYLGHSVGRIRDVDLVPGRSEVVLAIDRDADLPAAIVAVARRRSAIGEPYVDLAPAPGNAGGGRDRLGDGARIPIGMTSSPLQYGDLFRSLDRLVTTVDADALGVVVDELARAVDGRGDDIRRIVIGTEDLVTTLSENGDRIEELIDGVAGITDVLATNRDALGSGIDHLAGLTEALEQARPDIEALIDEGPTTIALLNAIIGAADQSVICTIDGTAALDAILDAEALQSLTGLLQRSAAFADVIDLVQDERDGVFRLMVSPSGGNPPTVEFAAPAPFPGTPTVPGCPAHDVILDVAPVADEAAPGPGGDRSAAGASDLDAGRPDRADPTGITGLADAAGGDAFLTRVARWSLPLLALAAILLVGRRIVPVVARRRGGNDR